MSRLTATLAGLVAALLLAGPINPGILTRPGWHGPRCLHAHHGPRCR